MKDWKRWCALPLCAAALVALAACSPSEPEAPSSEAESSIVYAQTDPERLSDVIDQIYEDIDMKGLQDAGLEQINDLFHIETGLISDYAARYSSGRYGVADVVIVKVPDEQSVEPVIEALEQRRTERVSEFENYDVHDAYRIAQEAEIFSRGDYVIMLMVDDLDAARTVIYETIPG